MENTDNAETTEAVGTEETPDINESMEADNQSEEQTEASGDKYEDAIERLLSKAEAEDQGIEVEPETLRKGESWDDIYSSQTPEAQRALQSLRKDYTKKTQAIAEQRKELEAEREKLMLLQQNLTSSEGYKAVKEMAEADAGEFDPYDPESFGKYVEKLVAQRIQDVMKPMYEEQVRTETRVKLDKFKAENPDLMNDESIRNEVKTLLMNNKDMRLETAYWVVKGRNARQSEKTREQNSVKQRRAAKAAGLRLGRGKKAGMTTPPNANELRATEIYDYLLAQKK
tara:strand:- start:90 stop:941 length:852 start_codon:yes stop_codon:yes gene_type:complete